MKTIFKIIVLLAFSLSNAHAQISCVNGNLTGTGIMITPNGGPISAGTQICVSGDIPSFPYHSVDIFLSPTKCNDNGRIGDNYQVGYPNRCTNANGHFNACLTVGKGTCGTTYYLSIKLSAISSGCSVTGTGCGCNTSLCSLPFTYSGTNSIAPTSITANSTSTCSGSCVSLTVNGGSLGTGANWKFYKVSCGGTLLCSTTGSQCTNIDCPTSNTTYFVRAEGTCNTTNCVQTTVTVNTVPMVVTVMGGGTFCNNNITLTASGGSGGIIYWQNNISGGTSTATQSTSRTVNTPGTYYFRAHNYCGWGPQGSTTVTINNTPSAPILQVVNNCGNSIITASNYTGTLTWSDGGSGNPRTVISGSYTVTQTVNNCTSAASNQVTASPLPVPSAPTLQVVNNCGNSTITASNYTGTLSWSDGGNGNPRNVISGCYTVTQTRNNCTSSASNQVTASPFIIPSAPVLHVINNCGNSTITASNYTGTLTWSDGGSGNPRTVISGSYTVTQTINNCTSSASNQVTASPLPVPLAPTLHVVNNCGNSIITASNYTGTLTWSDGGSGNPRTVISGSYTVTQTVNNCTGAASNQVTASPLSVPSAPTLQVVNNCGNSTITASNYTGTLSWSDGGSGNPRTVTAGSYTVTQTVNNCTGAASNQVTASPLPVPSAPTLQVVNNCGNSTITASNYTGTLSWSDGGNGNPRTVTAGSYTVTQTVNNCTSVASNQVTASPLPIPSSPTTGNNGPICAGTTLFLTASHILNATYSWIGPNAFTSNLQNPTITNVTLADSGIYFVTATVNGCESSSDTTLVNVNALPNANAWNDTTLCVGIKDTLHASGGISYLWSNNNTTPDIIVGVASTTIFYVSVTGANGCIAIDSVKVTVDKPMPTIICDSDIIICNQSYSHYQWYYNNVSLFGQHDSICNSVGTGTYYVEVVDSLDCNGISDSCYISIPVSINSLIQNNIDIYPNPANDNLTVEYPVIADNEMVSIYNIQGNLILQLPIFRVKTDINISDIEKGLYFLRLESENGTVVKKFIKI